jgi:hypothetical protein
VAPLHIRPSCCVLVEKILEINAIFNVRRCNIDAFWPILHQMFAGEETGGLSSFLSSILGLVQYYAFAKILLLGPISVFCCLLFILMCRQKWNHTVFNTWCWLVWHISSFFCWSPCQSFHLLINSVFQTICKFQHMVVRSFLFKTQKYVEIIRRFLILKK